MYDAGLEELGNYCCLDMVVVEEPPGICSNGVHKKRDSHYKSRRREEQTLWFSTKIQLFQIFRILITS